MHAILIDYILLKWVIEVPFMIIFDKQIHKLLLDQLHKINYYPFGLKHKGYNSNINGTHHKYMFGGKEEQDDNVGGSQLNWLDFGARNYDPALVKWMNLDPLAELGLSTITEEIIIDE